MQYSCLQYGCLHIRLHSHSCTRLHAHTFACTYGCTHIVAHGCVHIRLLAHTAACTYCCTRLHALTRHTLAAHCSLHAGIVTLLALLTPFMLSLLHAGRFNCCYRSVRVRLVVTHRNFRQPNRSTTRPQCANCVPPRSSINKASSALVVEGSLCRRLAEASRHLVI